MAASRPPVYAEPDLLVVQPTAASLPAAQSPLEHVEHRLEVAEAGSFARAVCRGCSWSGPARRSRAVAAADAEQHPAR